MPDDELVNESGVPEEESSVSVEPSQEQEPSSDSSTDVEVDDSENELIANDNLDDLESDIPEDSNEDILDESIENVDDSGNDVSNDVGSSVSSNEIDYGQIQEMINKSVSENNALYLSDDYIVLEDLEEFESSTVLVDRYQYAVLEKLEFMQYALAIVISLLFLILFMRYKK